ncbi:MAG TPA: sulfate ABC transporter substrate-binding protein [Candidatus Baltobacteraceae bacterium]|nr:sulfate ABC transporter substrate-binding protein [Candidatus Baltobacteraceae bacterium]
MKFRLNVAIAAALAILSLAGTMVLPQEARADQSDHLLNVSYDATREFYVAYNQLFAEHWKKQTGRTVTIDQSHGGSGAQARAVIDGLDADVVTLGLASDVNAIAEKSKEIAPDWEKRLPHDSSPYTSTIVFVVRKGNPKNIRDWDDVTKPGVAIVTPNPKTSSAARWGFLAAYASALDRAHNNEPAAENWLKKLYHNVAVFDAGSRAATNTFADRGVGDVLIAWENEALFVQRAHPNDGYVIVTPSISILAQPPVAWVDANVAKHGTSALAKEYLTYLYSPTAQRLVCENGYRPVDATVLAACRTHFTHTELISVARFGGWKSAQAYFADHGLFDRVSESN